MDVSKFGVTGEWLELEVESKQDIGLLKFRVKPLSSTEQITIAEDSEGDPKKFLKKVEDLVVDWNLEKDGVPLPCTPENKTFYLPYLIGMKIKEEEEAGKEKEEKIVGMTIIEFAQDFGNFTKN
jgi:hypothetical protein